jgi:hypothetical protein
LWVVDDRGESAIIIKHEQPLLRCPVPFQELPLVEERGDEGRTETLIQGSRIKIFGIFNRCHREYFWLDSVFKVRIEPGIMNKNADVIILDNP